MVNLYFSVGNGDIMRIWQDLTIKFVSIDESPRGHSSGVTALVLT